LSTQKIFGYSISQIENRTEQEVASGLEKMLTSMEGICTCQLCVEDMFMIALNSLPARYQHRATLRLFKKDPLLTEDMVETAVKDAINGVSKRPKHE